MDISKIREKKTELEKKICELINRYESDTTVTVKKMEYSKDIRFSANFKDKTAINHVYITLEI